MQTLAQKIWPELRDMAFGLGLPHVIETTSYRQPCLKAHKKLWVWCSPHTDAFVFRLPVDERDFLIAAKPDTFFVTEHYKGYDLILVVPDKLDLAWAMPNLVRVWRAQAGKRALAAYDGR